MKKPILTVDVVIRFKGGVVLVKRKNKPYQGKWALPGGFVNYCERVELAAVREAREETGLRIRLQKLLGVYSDPERDPRGHTVSVCFLARQVGGKLKAASDAGEVKIFKKIQWKKLAFDHGQILKDTGVR